MDLNPRSFAWGGGNPRAFSYVRGPLLHPQKLEGVLHDPVCGEFRIIRMRGLQSGSPYFDAHRRSFPEPPDGRLENRNEAQINERGGAQRTGGPPEAPWVSSAWHPGFARSRSEVRIDPRTGSTPIRQRWLCAPWFV